MARAGSLGLGRNYHGDLAVPIDVEDATEAHTKAEFSRKLDLLFAEYGITPGNWEGLAFTLALHHVPGFQITYIEQPGRTGRPGVWSDERSRALARLVGRIMAEAKANSSQASRRTTAGACEYIARSGVDPQFATPTGSDPRTWGRTLAKQVSAARKRASAPLFQPSSTGRDAIEKHFVKPQD